jgi:hypothetical protein
MLQGRADVGRRIAKRRRAQEVNSPFVRSLLGALVLSAAARADALAQRDTSAVLRGVVTDSSGNPLESVEIAATTVGRLVRTDAEGRFSIGGVLVGRNRLLIRRLGWRAIDTTFVIDPRAPQVLRLIMGRLAQDLQAVHIVSQDECPTRTLEGFDCRRRAGLGAFRDSAEIAALHPVCVADIVRGMQGLRRVPGLPCPSFEPTTGWRCLQILVDGRVLDRGNMPPKLTSDYTGVEFYDDYEKAPEWYKQFAFAQYTVGVPTHQEVRGRAMIYQEPSLPGRKCSLLVYWTHFAPKFDPSLDQSRVTSQVMRARRDSLMGPRLDSARGKPDSAVQKKP